MRITRLYLKNFIGIKNGMDKDEIDISFPDNGNHIVMFNGRNGSGKSTIMSQLTPFKDSFDDRKGVIVPGKEGVKEIEIEHDGHAYKIQHVYATPPASFIQKDGVELNTNGGVRTFEDIVKTEFGLDKEYFKIGKIGSNTTNFIQFTPTLRKTYIANFVEAVQKYLDAYEIVNKKAKANDDSIQRLGNELKKIDDADTLRSKIEANAKAYDEYDRQASDASSEIGKCDASISAAKEANDGIDFIGDKAKLADIERKIEKNTEVAAKFKTQYADVTKDNIADRIAAVTNEIAEIKAESAKTESAKMNAASAKVDAENNIVKFKSHIDGKAVVDTDDLAKAIDDLRKIKAAGEEAIAKNQLTKVIKDKYSGAQSNLDSFSAFMKKILNNYSALNDHWIDPNRRNVELFFASDFKSVFGKYSNDLRDSIQATRDSADAKTAELAGMTANLEKLDILGKRPKDCRIDACPFIADALKYADLPEKIKNLDDELAKAKAKMKDNDELADKCVETQSLYSTMVNAFNGMQPKDNLAYAYFKHKHKGVVVFTNMPKTELDSAYKLAKSEFETAIGTIDSYNDATTKLAVAEAQYDRAVSAEKSRMYFEQEIANANADLARAEAAAAKADAKALELSSRLSKKSAELKDYEDFAVSLEDRGSLGKEKAALEAELAEYEKNAKAISSFGIRRAEQEKLLADAVKARTIVMNDITKLKADEMTLLKLQSDLAALKATFADTSVIKKALDPKSGIPLVFVQSYLDGTESIANDLLRIAYGGKFEIKFVADAGNFFIQVRSGGNVIDDIKYASQGEIAMTTISISLALIERSLGKFDIMYLDEIDGPLDKSNRESFINIINKQISKLGLEQIFVISHNNAFDSCDMNLVLLPGHSVDKDDADFMKNKTVIFNAEE